MDLRALREQHRDDVTGADGIPRTRAQRGHARPLATVSGPVTVTRIVYRAPGAPNMHPLDAIPARTASQGRVAVPGVER